MASISRRGMLTGGMAAAVSSYIVKAGAQERRLRSPSSPVEVDVREFGAVLDGVSDDTQALFDAAASAVREGKALRIPKGILLFQKTWVIPHDLRVLGSEGESVLRPGSGIGLEHSAIAAKPDASSASRYAGGYLVFRDLMFDCGARRYPRYLSRDDGTRVIDPTHDKSRNSLYTQRGRVLSVFRRSDVHIERCSFVGSDTFTLVLEGCVRPRVTNNTFLRCGKEDDTSPAVYCGDAGVYRYVTTASRSNPCVITLSVPLPKPVTDGGRVWIEGFGGMREIVDGYYRVETTSTPSGPGLKLLDVDSSGFSHFVFDGRALAAVPFWAPGKDALIETNTFSYLRRVAIHISTSGGGNVRENKIDNVGESGIFCTHARDFNIARNHINNVTMKDVAAHGVEINYGVDLSVLENTISATEGCSVGVVGGYNQAITANTCRAPFVTADISFKYGPTAERYPTGPSIAGRPVPKTIKAFIQVQNRFQFPFSGSISKNRFSDSRADSGLTALICVLKSGVEGMISSLDVSNNDASEVKAVQVPPIYVQAGAVRRGGMTLDGVRL